MRLLCLCCVYSNQADDSVLACEWQLENDQLWKSLSPEAISMLTPYVNLFFFVIYVLALARARYFFDSIDGIYLFAYLNLVSQIAIGVLVWSDSQCRRRRGAAGVRIACVAVGGTQACASGTCFLNIARISRYSVCIVLHNLSVVLRSQMEMIFDSEFSYLLSPSLSAYEWERITGFAYGNDEFQQAVKQHIPIGYVFKACVFRFCSRPVFARIGVIIS
jgi:hypothetical protein